MSGHKIVLDRMNYRQNQSINQSNNQSTLPLHRKICMYVCMYVCMYACVCETICAWDTCRLGRFLKTLYLHIKMYTRSAFWEGGGYKKFHYHLSEDCQKVGCIIYIYIYIYMYMHYQIIFV